MASKVAERREARISEIVDAAWGLAREHGIAGVSLHSVAREVGMRQPSLYSYFDSKHALYDAMFAAGNRQLVERLHALDLDDEPRAALHGWLEAFVAFCLEDAARYELMFLRPVPGFVPTPESYAVAGEVLATMAPLLGGVGLSDPGDVDCLVAMVAGIVDAQIANDPGGDRWTRHLHRLIDLLVDDAVTRIAGR